MLRFRTHRFLCISILGVFSSALLSDAARSGQSPAAPAPAADFKATSVPVYVAPFEINPGAGGPAAASPPAKRPEGSPQQPESPFVFQDSDATYLQVIRLKKFFSDTLIQVLQKNGYSATLQAGSRPEKGVLIRGVFTEVDSRNRNCLALLGGTAPTTGFLLYVGTQNLARPDQPLYQPVQTESCDPRFGQLITLNNYIPMTKHEMSKNPTEEDVRRVCDRIASDLTALLNANSTAFSQ